MGNVYINWCDKKTCEGCSKIDACHFGELYKELKAKELYIQMQLSEIKPGMKVRHKATERVEVVIDIFKSNEGGKWHDAVLYGQEGGTMYGRSVEDFTANFEPLEGTVLGDDLPFTSEGEPFTSKGKEGRNCENCHWLKVVEDRAVCAIWNTRITDTTRKCKDFRE